MATWEELQNEFSKAKNKPLIYPCTSVNNIEILNLLGITDHSVLGAIIKNTSGLSFYNEILRIMGGSESDKTDSIEKWIGLDNKIENFPEKVLIIAYDLLGGIFVINGGGLGDELGKVFYFAPDTLNWENMNVGHSDFFAWCLNGDLELFYKTYIWDNSEELFKTVKRGEGILSYPFLWSIEGKDLNKTNKKIISIEELWSMSYEIKGKLI